MAVVTVGYVVKIKKYGEYFDCIMSMEVKIMAPLKEEPNGWNAVIRMVLN
jgi:hypothetical protein